MSGRDELRWRQSHTALNRALSSWSRKRVLCTGQKKEFNHCMRRPLFQVLGNGDVSSARFVPFHSSSHSLTQFVACQVSNWFSSSSSCYLRQAVKTACFFCLDLLLCLPLGCLSVRSACPLLAQSCIEHSAIRSAATHVRSYVNRLATYEASPPMLDPRKKRRNLFRAAP